MNLMQRWQKKRSLLINPTDISTAVCAGKKLFSKTRAVSSTFITSKMIRAIVVFYDEASAFYSC